jgi:hypothetical protein
MTNPPTSSRRSPEDHPTLGEAMIVPLIHLFYLHICDRLDAAPADAERFGRLRLVHARAPRPRISPPTATARCEQPSTTG